MSEGVPKMWHMRWPGATQCGSTGVQGRQEAGGDWSLESSDGKLEES